jgi:hypothetical protein
MIAARITEEGRAGCGERPKEMTDTGGKGYAIGTMTKVARVGVSIGFERGVMGGATIGVKIGERVEATIGVGVGVEMIMSVDIKASRIASGDHQV